MSLLVVGSIAFDTVETPHGRLVEGLGGSAMYFSYAASFFTPVRLCGIAGSDFPSHHLEALRLRNVDLDGFQTAEGKTFRWSGSYQGDMSTARTHETQLNVYGSFDPVLPESYHDTRYAFLANGPTDIQHKIIDQLDRDCIIFADTMNLWIDTQRKKVLELLERITGMVLNDSEARMLSGETSLVRACRWIQERGARYVVVKKGEHGALALAPEGFLVTPAYPAEKVFDPTGAGDSFAGALMGYIAGSGGLSKETFAQALLHGTVMASFTIEDFSLNRLAALTREDFDARLVAFKRCLPR